MNHFVGGKAAANRCKNLSSEMVNVDDVMVLRWNVCNAISAMHFSLLEMDTEMRGDTSLTWICCMARAWVSHLASWDSWEELSLLVQLADSGCVITPCCHMHILQIHEVFEH